MTNSELQEIKQYCEKKRLITKKDVEDFVILNESDRKILIRFLMLDLSKRNILYKLNAKYYKYTKDLIRFDYRYNELDTPIK
ncbi:MAG: hypothetical protein LBM99_04000 [Bacillales bacterium]|jgi:hypothetical protein|nr:hypothetical protein [Bacillales bacterium]